MVRMTLWSYTTLTDAAKQRLRSDPADRCANREKTVRARAIHA